MAFHFLHNLLPHTPHRLNPRRVHPSSSKPVPLPGSFFLSASPGAIGSIVAPWIASPVPATPPLEACGVVCWYWPVRRDISLRRQGLEVGVERHKEGPGDEIASVELLERRTIYGGWDKWVGGRLRRVIGGRTEWKRARACHEGSNLPCPPSG